MGEEVTIATDAFPYEAVLHRVSDYSGEQIYAKLALPLFVEKEKKVTYLAAANHSVGSDSKSLRIKIREDLFWSNGEQVVAEDYVRAVKFLCRDHKNRFKTLFSDLENYGDFVSHRSDCMGVEFIDRYTLIFFLKYPHRNFIDFLTILVVSPLHYKDASLTAGPYYLDFQSENVYRLKKNPHFKLDTKENCFNLVSYKLCSDDKEGDSFWQNQVDVTCNTGLDYQYFDSVCKNRFFYNSDHDLIMILSPGKQFDEIPKSVKSILSNVVDREKICAQFCNIPTPAHSYLSNYYEISDLLNKNEVTPLKDPYFLTIAFENFYPNKEIIDELSRQLEAYNIYLVSLEDAYGHWKSTSHIRLEIRKSINSTPILLYKADISRGLLDKESFDRARKYYSLLLQKDNPQYFIEIDKILIQSCVYIPLMIVKTGFLAKSHIIRDTLFSCGDFIGYKIDEAHP